VLECLCDSVLNFPVPDGRSGQQTVDMIQKKLETLGAEKTGNFAVDSETYQSQSRTRCIFNPLIPTLKPQSNGPLYCNTVICTLAVDGWAVTCGTARRGMVGLGFSAPLSKRSSTTVSELIQQLSDVEQSSSRYAPIPDIFYFQNTPEVISVQYILPFSLTVYH